MKLKNFTYAVLFMASSLFAQKAETPQYSYDMGGKISFMKLTDAGVLVVAGSGGLGGIKPGASQTHFLFKDYGKIKPEELDFIPMSPYVIIKNTSLRPIKFVLMNTAGNSNRDLDEPVSVGQKIVIGLLRLLLPPHPDNENAADYLRKQIGKSNEHIEWVVVRPDNLINEENVSDYSLHKSPTRSAIFNPGKTSRINVGDFMARLLTNDNLWSEWKGQMPVIYNANK